MEKFPIWGAHAIARDGVCQSLSSISRQQDLLRTSAAVIENFERGRTLALLCRLKRYVDLAVAMGRNAGATFALVGEIGGVGSADFDLANRNWIAVPLITSIGTGELFVPTF